MKKIFISQSNYIPWVGYFDAINSADEFVILDNVQYTKNDWRNRNRINTSDGIKWLSIPVYTKGHFPQKINEAKICNHFWAKKHLKALQFNYSKSPYFKEYFPQLEKLYLSKNYTRLSELNHDFILLLCKQLDIKTKITRAEDYGWEGKNKTDAIINICKKAGATIYLSGPAAKTYLNKSMFEDAGIELQYIDYAYNRLFPDVFPSDQENVSVVDLLFNKGNEIKKYFILTPAEQLVLA